MLPCLPLLVQDILFSPTTSTFPTQPHPKLYAHHTATFCWLTGQAWSLYQQGTALLLLLLLLLLLRCGHRCSSCLLDMAGTGILLQRRCSWQKPLAYSLHSTI
jgi:hypothetical protein